MTFNKKLHIVLVVEKGILEQQALLLVESINRFVAPFLKVNILAFSPRNIKFHPSQSTIKKLQHLGAEYINLPLNITHDYFPLCNGIYASSYAEQMASSEDLLLLVDTDTVFLKPFEQNVLNYNGVSMRPVDNKGVGSTGADDPNDGFWTSAFEYFDLKPQRNKILTTICKQSIRPYYNSGFVMCPQHFSFFNEWKFCFEQLMNSDIRSEASFSRYSSDFGFLEQMALSIVSEKKNIPTQLLPPYYNYPIPFRHNFINTTVHIPFSKLHHVHYHRWFQHPGFLDHVTTVDDKKNESFQWVKQYIPFHPKIDEPFKK